MSKAKFNTRESEPVHATFVTHRNAPSDGFLFLWGPEHPSSFDWSGVLRRNGFGAIPPSSLIPTDVRMILPAREGRFRIDSVSGRRLSMAEVLQYFGTATLQASKRFPLCPSMTAWSLAAKFALELIARQCFTPMLRTYAHDLYAAWQVTLESSLDVGRVRQLAAMMPPCAHALYSKPHNRADRGGHQGRFRRPTMMWHPEALLRAFLDAAIDHYIRAVFRDPRFEPVQRAIQEKLDAVAHRHASMPLAKLLMRDYDKDIEHLKSCAVYMAGLTANAQDAPAEPEADDEEDAEFEGEVADEEETDEEVAEDEEEDSRADRDANALSGEKEELVMHELKRLMPMKEFVYTAPCELESLPCWVARWFRALLCNKRQSTLDYHLEDPLLVEGIQTWIAPLHENADTKEVTARTGFWLETPTADSMNFWFLRYVLVAVDDPSLAVPANLVFSVGTEHLRINQHLFENPQETLLTGLGKAAQFFEPLKSSLQQATPEGVFLDVHQVWTFISEVSPLLTAEGFDVRLPEQLTAQGNRRLRARFRICDPQPEDFDKRYFGMNDLAGFRWEAALGDEVVSAEEFREIVALKQPLVQWHGSWVLVDPVQLHDIEQLINSNETHGTITRFDAMNRALTGVADPNSPDSHIEVIVEGKIASVLDKLSQEDIADMTLKAPDTFVGTLRPYQERGVAWLSYQQRLGLGCCLADDMGLGKTIQLICHVLNQMQRHPEDNRGTLLICPMSVVGNWRREFQRFAPSVHVVVHHGSSRAQTHEELCRQIRTPGSVVITTYGLIMRSDLLLEHHWSMVVLDEAQAIKNASSKRSILVREIPADFRVALTGTPIENRLAELWSILDFLNPGLLGTNAKFQRLYGIPIERYNDEAAMERLRNLVSPFIMRRVKTDPKIIQDLPEKMERKVYCTLTREQATMYQALVDSTMKKIENAQGITRHGHVLALLTHLKQIVDHPTLYEKSSPLTCNRSGKVQRLIEMLETIIENGERALIFTQFKEMGDALVSLLGEALGIDNIPFLHGGLSASQRDALVDDFQSEDGSPVFILSLKAGGTGLNLTSASHVFHFDRWWNPAVEDQATDRAFRIGQNKNVQVHKFLTLGTLEEKIDTMLEEKKSLSDSIVDATGAWITQFDTDGLRELFSLSSDAMIDEAD